MKNNGQLLQGVVPGDYISVVYGGAASLFSAEGYVKHLGEVLVLTREGWGLEVRIPAEWLVSVTVAARAAAETHTTDAGNTAQAVCRLRSDVIVGDDTLPPAPQAQKEQKKENAAPAAEPAMPVSLQPGRELVPLAARVPWTPDLEEELNQLRAAIKNVGSKTVRNTLNAILDSTRDAQKTGSIAEKYQGLRAKTLALWDSCTDAEDYYCFYWALGLLALCAEDNLRALEPLVRCQRYTMASYAAEQAGHEEYRGLFAVCALMAGEPGAQVNQDIADICLKRQDAGPLQALLERRGEDKETAELVLSCAWYLCSHAGCSVDVDWENPDAADLAKKLLSALPAAWKQESRLMRKWEIYDQYTYPVAAPEKEKSEDDAWITGTIKNYRPDRRFGFISVDGIENNVYFYIKQVAAEKPIDLFLRNLLYQGKAVGLEVSFTMGESQTRKGQCSANDIYLTEKGYDEGVKRIIAAQHPEEKTGCITEYPNEAGFGRLTSNGKPCNYLMDSIVDPYLRAYLSLRTLDHSFHDQSVLFLPEFRGGKLTAQKIRWKDPRDVDLELARSQVSEDSAALWKEYLAALEEAQKAPTELPDKTDPYPSYGFELLDDWVSPTAEAAKDERPLTWKVSNSTPERVPLQTPQTPPVRRTQPSASAQTSFRADRTDSSNTANTSAKQLADRGKKAILANELDTGEQLLLQALEQGAPADLVVGDLISLYLRIPEKLPEGISLLERYQAALEPDKVLNMRISLYDKQHNYDALLPLYEEAIRTSSSAARKSHNLFRMLSTLMEMERDEQALEVCDRWDKLFRESTDGSDAEKLRNAAPNVDRKRMLCLFRLGKEAEAKVVAEQLLRLNPEDEYVLQVLQAHTASASQNAAPEAPEAPYAAAEEKHGADEATPAEEAPAPAEEPDTSSGIPAQDSEAAPAAEFSPAQETDVTEAPAES